MPNGIFAVSPWTTSTLSIGMPRPSATSCAKVVSCPWPWLWLPVKTVTEPVGWTRTSAVSYKPARAPSAPATFEGAIPQASI